MPVPKTHTHVALKYCRVDFRREVISKPSSQHFEYFTFQHSVMDGKNDEGDYEGLGYHATSLTTPVLVPP
jgi:hypothetical protein